jgi:DNA-binding response OmpR family regulator
MPSAKRVLLVDEDVVLRASLAEQLAREGSYAVIEAASGAEARGLAKDGGYAFAIIDHSLADGGGETLVRELRTSGFDAPILFLSEQDGPTPSVEHIEKPFRFAALLAHLNAHLGPHVPSDETPFEIGPYLFRPGAKLLVQDERKVHLTEKETDILKFLHAAAATVARETLLHEVWGYNPAVTTHTLETHIYRLRKKIEENPGEARILLTEGGGYRLASRLSPNV